MAKTASLGGDIIALDDAALARLDAVMAPVRAAATAEAPAAAGPEGPGVFTPVEGAPDEPIARNAFMVAGAVIGAAWLALGGAALQLMG